MNRNIYSNAHKLRINAMRETFAGLHAWCDKQMANREHQREQVAANRKFWQRVKICAR